ncbi:YueI family protein [Jeotgalibacillus marinus]|uniref:YueI family protein n=1 Tax=Jeotgalibacillus marinus TaxID=86667 RepID=A0ABV3Q3Q9_9BACL
MAEGKKNVDDYLQEGIYGAKDTLPDERRMYLGTIRERIELVLLQNQLREDELYPEVEQAIKAYPDIHLYLNGNMAYRFLSKYIQLASNTNASYTVVTNKEHNSPYGLVAAHGAAVEREEIDIQKRTSKDDKNKSKGSFFSKLFGENK